MTWSLSATGHAIVEDVEGAVAALESELVAELHKVLSNPKWGTIASHFGGVTITSDVHTARPAATAPAIAERGPASEAAPATDAETAAAAEPEAAPAEETVPSADAEPTADPAPAGA